MNLLQWWFFVVAAVARPALAPIEKPFEIWVSSLVREQWLSFADLETSRSDGAVRIEAMGADELGMARVDVVHRRENHWVWSSTSRYDSEFAVSSSDSDQGILVRFQHSTFYYWGVVPAHSRMRARLDRYKTLEVAGAPPGAALLLYVSSESEPRILPRRADRFELVPVAEALACATTAAGSRCVRVAPFTTRSEIEEPVGDSVRVFRSEQQNGEIFEILAAGRVPVPATRVKASALRAGQWVALCMNDNKRQWDAVVVDRRGDELALERVDGASLPNLPAFTELSSGRERGIVIRPRIGANREPLSDLAALLVVYSAGSGLSAEIPLGTSSPDKVGEFPLPSLPPGTYTFKLFSALSTGSAVQAIVTTAEPAVIEFPSGPRINGTVVRNSGGSFDEDVLIEVGPLSMGSAASKGNLLEGYRYAIADPAGRFSVAAGAPGRYRLRARWGFASAERDFEVTSTTRSIDVGIVELRRGSTLRGSVEGCAAGEAVLARVPDLSKPLVAAMPELRRSPIEEGGGFIVESLSPGPWSVSFVCGGDPMRSTPEVLRVPEAGDVIMAFSTGPRIE